MYSLPAPYGDCATEDAVPLKYHQGPYTENQCYLECETDYIVEKCGCRHFYMPGIIKFECCVILFKDKFLRGGGDSDLVWAGLCVRLTIDRRYV